ncbi:Flap-structured DNA-binding and RNA-binding protein [Marasmius sp. AFHP31]|nr:Flap-structured DNA-binding and RNA-binding protein [Marasmius sp. AFHP31]
MPATSSSSSMLSPQIAIPKPQLQKLAGVNPASPLRPNAAVFSPILSPRPGAAFGIPPSPRFGGVGGELDDWFKNLRKYEARMGAMAAASEEPKFREELGTIEQWFTLLNDSEQDATLYSLIQHASQEQITFLKAILQQLSDPMLADSRQSSPATTRPPLHVRLPGTPRTPGFSLASALSPATTQNKDLERLEKSAAGPGPSPLSAVDPTSQELFIKGSEDFSWANMVNTPMDLMFQKPQKSAHNPTGSMPMGIPNPMMGMAMMNPLAFNQGMAGYTNEAQLLALQLMMNGMTMQSQQLPQQSQPPVGNNQNQKSGSQQRQQQKGQSSAGASNWRSAPSKGTSKTPSKPKSAAGSSTAVTAAATPTTRPEDDVDPELLKDIPAWLKTLRLHKYTECFAGMTWQEIVVLDEDQLEKMGVTALGARKRLTKNFEGVKRKMGMAPANPDDAAAPGQEPAKDTATSP